MPRFPLFGFVDTPSRHPQTGSAVIVLRYPVTFRSPPKSLAANSVNEVNALLLI